MFFNLRKFSHDLGVRVESGGRASFALADSLPPGGNQCVSRFHPCAKWARDYIHARLRKMKAGIHPEYYETDIVCACGAVYHTRSTRRDIKIGICAACHPFFTGEQKFVDTAGRVEKFTRRYGSTKATRADKKA